MTLALPRGPSRLQSPHYEPNEPNEPSKPRPAQPTHAEHGTPGPSRHLAQLDGVRAVAISAVIAYHLGYLPGGWLGVDVFFVLSGYLITWILLSKGGLRQLGSFWGRRARRLLPAVLVLVGVISVYAWAGGRGLVPAQIRLPAWSTVFYSANWQEIVAGHSYFAQYLQPNPFQHAWSLAIEEQYYLLWPLILGALVTLFPGSARGRPGRPVIVSTALLAIASAVWMGLAAHLFGANRAYLGTDTRAWELLLGGAAAMLWPPGRAAGDASPADREASTAERHLRDRQPRHPRPAATALTLGALGLAVGIATAGGPPAWIWDGGLVAVALCATALIVGCVHAGASALARLLGSGPVSWLGVISYSLYLWHWPAIVLISPAATGLSGPSLLGARLAAMLGASCASYYLVERPLRTRDWRRLGRRLHVRAPAFAAVGIAAAAALVAVGTAGPGRAPSARLTAQSFPGPTAAERQQHLDLAPARPGDPYRVWIIGDSVMFDSSLGITAALQSTGGINVVANTSFPGWSPRLDKGWATQAAQTISTYHPQIVLGTWSWDDPEAAANPAAYLQFLESTVRTLLAPGNGVQAVVLFQFPQAGPPTNSAGASETTSAWRAQTGMQTAWNDVARRAVTAFPGRAIYLTTDRAFAPGGRYYTWFKTSEGAWLRARKVDNVHMCPYGAALFGALADADLSYFLHLSPMEAGWATGSWTHDPRYNDPPGACPDDQPPPGYAGVAVPN